MCHITSRRRDSESDVPPTLISAFPEHTAHSGDTISLKCVTTGNPLPRITWYLDDILIDQGPRVTAVDRMGDLGHVTGILNITEARVEDSGEYRCQGRTTWAPPSTPPDSTSTAPFRQGHEKRHGRLRGRLDHSMSLRGYPIKGIKWFKKDWSNPDLALHHNCGVMPNPGYSRCNVRFIEICPFSNQVDWSNLRWPQLLK
ncbi:down syndrome cell adhesion molecule-like protein Dscam2 [Caerostris extrusa]|uniref:Down syndrome cell adhesion molecule-like protein Dscam2 n=1 Tax=Caerostris extrusa TaxID=172846 RepID=A0AAV4TAN3_CAEEX|nr:down syndrome cell adhesion molecule-like protein Dscam2 [Caerostris extrusa]